MQTISGWRPRTLVNLAMAMTLIVALSACASNRVKPPELSQEIPQSAFNEDNWDTYRSDRQIRTFKERVKAKRTSTKSKSSVAGF